MHRECAFCGAEIAINRNICYRCFMRFRGRESEAWYQFLIRHCQAEHDYTRKHKFQSTEHLE